MAYIGNTPTTQAFTPAVDFFSGNGSTTAFTLSRPVASVAQVQAVVENVPQMPGDAYTVSGNTITFTSAPPSGTNNIYVYYTSPITQVISPSQGTVFPSSLSTGGPYWDTNSNVGIGTSSPNKSGSNLAVTVNAALGQYPALELSTNNVGRWYINADATNVYDTAMNNTNRTFYTGGSERMRIDSSGNVGIGMTPSGDSRQEIYGADSATIYKNSATGTGLSDGFYVGMAKGSSTTAYVFNRENAPLIFGTNNTNRASISETGMFNVGQSNNSAWMTVYGAGIAYPNAAGFAGVGANSMGMGWASPNIYGTVDNAVSAILGTVSDYRLKIELGPLTDSMQAVLALRPIKYNPKDFDGNVNTEKQELGLIAHEVAAIRPSVVTGEKDAVNSEGRPQYQSVNYAGLVPDLIACIQELNAKVEAQAAEIAALKGAA